MRSATDGGAERLVPAGTIGAPHGVEGAFRLWSETSPPEAIFGYAPWTLEKDGRRRTAEILEHGTSGSRLVVRLDLATNPEEARLWTGATVLVPRSSFPPAPPGAYYFADLLGLEVRDEDDRTVGTIEELTEAPAQPILRVRAGAHRRLVPFVWDVVVLGVDLEVGIVRVRRSALEE